MEKIGIVDMKMKNYRVQQYHEELGWKNIPFAESHIRAYCDGWVSAMDSMYPSPPMRIISKDSEGNECVVRETKGRAKPHTN